MGVDYQTSAQCKQAVKVKGDHLKSSSEEKQESPLRTALFSVMTSLIMKINVNNQRAKHYNRVELKKS